MDETLPVSLETEKATLSSMFIDPNIAIKCVASLEEDSFFDPRNVVIFRAACDLIKDDHTLDAVTILDKVDRRVVSVKYLAELIDFIPDGQNIDSYINILREKENLRNLSDICDRLKRKITEGLGSSEDIFSDAEEALFSVTSGKVHKDSKRVKDILWSVYSDIEERIQNGGSIPGIPSGFRRLDYMTSGFKPGQLIIVAGRPAMGKTSFAVNVALNAAINHGVGVAMFSLEMSEDELVERMLSSEGKINSQKLRIGQLSSIDHERLSQVGGLIAQAPIFINDNANLSPIEMKSTLRRLMVEHDIGLVIVDYLQLMHGGDSRLSGNRVQEVTKISRDLKVLARDLELPVVALSQLNRSAESRDNHRPLLSDLRESGAIEQDADLVMFVFREEEYGKINRRGENVEGKAEIIIRKQRSGPTGKVSMTFIPEYTRFEESDPVAPPPKVDKQPAIDYYRREPVTLEKR